MHLEFPCTIAIYSTETLTSIRPAKMKKSTKYNTISISHDMLSFNPYYPQEIKETFITNMRSKQHYRIEDGASVEKQ